MVFKGRIFSGINNIYEVYIPENPGSGRIMEARIKGKQLKDELKRYNPITVGDQVIVEPDPHSENRGVILERLERKNHFSRWNKKRASLQTIAANVDRIYCVTSPESPPFRPRFIDRVLLAGAIGDVPVTIICNKIDQVPGPDVVERLENYNQLGIRTFLCSAKTGDGLDLLKADLDGKTAAFVGQSGVGKSTLLNALAPGIDLKTSSVSKKHNRGQHTTCYSLMITWPFGYLIDTPGIREIDLYGIEADDLDHYFPDFKELFQLCEFSRCSHRHEPGCAVRKAVEEGAVHPDRYESYVRIYGQLEYLEKSLGE